MEGSAANGSSAGADLDLERDGLSMVEERSKVVSIMAGLKRYLPVPLATRKFVTSCSTEPLSVKDITWTRKE